MDLRINQLESRVQPLDGQDQIAQRVRDEIRKWKEEEAREKRAERERDLHSGISSGDR